MTDSAPHKTTGRRESILAQQELDWPKHLAGAKAGNPWATLCLHCYGRHPPPKDEICPHNPPSLGRGGEHLDRRTP